MNPNELITKADLLQLEQRLYQRLDSIVCNNPASTQPAETKYLKAKAVRAFLGGISINKLKDMRIQEEIPFTEIAGIKLYPLSELRKILEDNLRPNH